MITCLFFNRLARHAHQQRANSSKRQFMVYLYMFYFAQWHPGIDGFVRILHNGDSAVAFHGPQPGSTIIQDPCKDHSHYTWAIGQSDRTEYGGGVRPVTVPVRPASNSN